MQKIITMKPASFKVCHIRSRRAVGLPSRDTSANDVLALAFHRANVPAVHELQGQLRGFKNTP